HDNQRYQPCHPHGGSSCWTFDGMTADDLAAWSAGRVNPAGTSWGPGLAPDRAAQDSGPGSSDIDQALLPPFRGASIASLLVSVPLCPGPYQAGCHASRSMRLRICRKRVDVK